MKQLLLIIFLTTFAVNGLNAALLPLVDFEFGVKNEEMTAEKPDLPKKVLIDVWLNPAMVPIPGLKTVKWKAQEQPQVSFLWWIRPEFYAKMG